jgi:hypothetical protein
MPLPFRPMLPMPDEPRPLIPMLLPIPIEFMLPMEPIDPMLLPIMELPML